MDADRWQRLRELFEQASALAAPARAPFLDQSCADDPTLRALVDDLFAADARPSPLDHALIDPLAADGDTAPSPVVPAQVDRYRILHQIGEGGMGTVHLATRDDDSFERTVVIKLARAGIDAENQRHLARERRILAALEHPAIARLYDGGTTAEGVPYVVLEYIDGLPIDQYCRDHELDWRARVALFRRVCAAVRYAHQNLVVHRDLKPANILVDAAGEPKLLDFGIARVLDPARAHDQTIPWRRRLTPSFASPEHLRGEAPTTASDVYSLGVLLYVLLTDDVPYRFSDSTPHAIERAWAAGDPVPPSVRMARSASGRQTRVTTARDLDSIVLKALALRASSRYPSVEQLDDDLDRHARGFPVRARDATPTYRAARFVRRHRLALTVLACVLSLVTGFAIILARQNVALVAERDRAQQQERQKQAVLDTLLDLFRQDDPFETSEARADVTVRDALARTAPRRLRMLEDQPETQATVLHEIGLIYHHLGLETRARGLLERALALRRATLGPRHPAVAETLSVIAALPDEDDLGVARVRASEAVALLRQARHDEPGSASDVALVRALNVLVAILCEAGAYDDALRPAVEAVETARGLPRSHYARAFATINLAAVHGGLGDYARAAERYDDALTLLEQQLGPESPSLVPLLINRGVARRNRDRLADALADYDRAWSLIAPRGSTHRLALQLLNNRARLHFAMGNHQAALEGFVRARDGLRQRGEEASPLVPQLEMRIAECQIELGQAEVAEATLRRLLTDGEPRLGAHDPWIQQTRGVLGVALARQGHLAEAETLLRTSYDALRDHPRARMREEALDRLATFLVAQDRDSELAALTDAGDPQTHP